MSDHSECEHANFPPCALNDFPHPAGQGNHGPAIGLHPMVNALTGETRAIWICAFCNDAIEIAQAMGPFAIGTVLTKIAERAKSWEAVEQDVLAALGAHPGDVHLNDLLGAIHESQRLIAERDTDTPPTPAVVVDDVNTMAAGEIAALFARTSTSNPEREN